MFQMLITFLLILIFHSVNNLHFAGKNFLRPNDMNINVATWGRLMKNAIPSQCGDVTGALSPPPGIRGLLFTLFQNGRPTY